METKHLQSWDAFEEELHALESSGKQNPTSFRGQSDAKWQLRTTLERFMEHAEGSDKVEMLRYYNMIASVKNRIETFTSNTWELPDGKGFIDFLEKSNNWFGSLPGLEYMAYLRHHGYPSPLLDWSRSPYIAAYFAFRDVYSKAENVAIFSYTLDLEDINPIIMTDPLITILSWSIKSDRRHFLQQSLYTICTVKPAAEIFYCSHEDVFVHGRPSRFKLLKYVLPSSERRRALKKLDNYNINAYSIFQSEDSILETALLRDYVGEIDYYLG